MQFAINAIPIAVRFSLKDLEKDYAKTEEDIKAVQSVGQIIGEVMKQLDDERCASPYGFAIY
jgi:ATP-dependent 26S proteasome regulatory subunit